MVIHTKEKAELHIKQEPEAKIKGRNVLVVDKSPKIAVMDKEDKTVIKKSSEKEAVKNSMQKEKGVYAQVQRAKQDREKAIGKKNSTAISPGVGTAIGLAAGSVVGYTAGVEMDYKDMKATSRARKLKFFLDKMNAEEQQKDSFAKLVKDLVVWKVFMMIKAAAPIIGLVLLLLVLLVAVVAILVGGSPRIEKTWNIDYGYSNRLCCFSGNRTGNHDRFYECDGRWMARLRL